MGIATKLLSVGSLALALGACAGQPAQVAEKKAEVDRNCLRETGTRIKLREDQCAPDRGRVYTNDDLQRTGAQTLNEAISRVAR